MPKSTQVNQTADSVGKKKYIKIIEMDNDFEESDCEEMPDLNLTASAVQPYMFEPTKGTEGEKSASGSEENSDSDRGCHRERGWNQQIMMLENGRF